MLQGSDAHAAGVQFPNDEDTLSRTLLVGNVSHQINSDQVCDLLSACRQNTLCLIDTHPSVDTIL